MKLLNILILFIFFSIESFSIKCLTNHPHKEKHLKNILQSDTLEPVYKRYFVESSDSLFRVHYYLEGEEAVNNTDLNQNNIPDYVDSVLYYIDDVRKFYIEKGWKEVPSDLGNTFFQNGDTLYENGGSEAYDIYLVNTGRAYGYASSLSSYTKGGVTYYPSNIFIRHNYDSTAGFATAGIDALKITLAHEYFHSIHFNYRYDRSASNDAILSEGTATYFENKYYPESTDFHQYVSLILTTRYNYTFKDGFGDGEIEYASCIIPKYLDKKYGENIIQELWNTDANYYILAINNVLENYNNNFQQTWLGTLDYLYHTGERSKDDYGFDNPESWPKLNFNFVDTLNSTAAKNKVENNFELLDLSFISSRILIERELNRTLDTIDILFSRDDSFLPETRDNILYEYNYSFDDQFSDNYNQIPETNYYLGLSSTIGEPNPLEITPLLYFRSGQEARSFETSYPNPFNPNSNGNINFPIPQNTIIFSRVDLTIFDSNFNPIKQLNAQSTVNNNFKTIELNYSEIDLPDGVYFFRTYYNQEAVFGKFAIISK
jgi:hypothetical protein